MNLLLAEASSEVVDEAIPEAEEVEEEVPDVEDEDEVVSTNREMAILSHPKVNNHPHLNHNGEPPQLLPKHQHPRCPISASNSPAGPNKQPALRRLLLPHLLLDGPPRARVNLPTVERSSTLLSSRR